MPHSYFKENCGFVSLWLGNFESETQLDEYLSTVYWNFNNETELEFQQKLNKLFLPKNAERPCENRFKEIFDEFYEQFEYDFAISYDEDFRERTFYDTPSDSIAALIGAHSYYQTFNQKFVDLLGAVLNEKYNVIVLIYDCNYDGYIQYLKHDQFEMKFMGAVPFERIILDDFFG